MFWLQNHEKICKMTLFVLNYDIVLKFCKILGALVIFFFLNQVIGKNASFGCLFVLFCLFCFVFFFCFVLFVCFVLFCFF